MESLLLMSYFMWSWDVLVHLFPSLSQLLGLKAWSLDSAVPSSARDAKNPQVALVSHGNFEDFWCGFWCRSFLTPIESVSFFAKTVDMCQRFMGDFLVWSPLPYLKKKFESPRSCSASLRRPAWPWPIGDLTFFWSSLKGWWMVDVCIGMVFGCFSFLFGIFMDQVAIRDFCSLRLSRAWSRRAASVDPSFRNQMLSVA